MSSLRWSRLKLVITSLCLTSAVLDNKSYRLLRRVMKFTSPTATSSDDLLVSGMPEICPEMQEVAVRSRDRRSVVVFPLTPSRAKIRSCLHGNPGEVRLGIAVRDNWHQLIGIHGWGTGGGCPGGGLLWVPPGRSGLVLKPAVDTVAEMLDGS